MRWLEPDPHEPKTILVELEVAPHPKVDTTQRSKWKPSNALLSYWDFKDRCAAEWEKTGLVLPDEGAVVIFLIPMPKSWSKKKKTAMQFKGHQAEPDIDNFLKGFLDSLFPRREGKCDSHIYDVHPKKFWHPGPGCIRVELPA